MKVKTCSKEVFEDVIRILRVVGVMVESSSIALSFWNISWVLWSLLAHGLEYRTLKCIHGTGLVIFRAYFHGGIAFQVAFDVAHQIDGWKVFSFAVQATTCCLCGKDILNCLRKYEEIFVTCFLLASRYGGCIFHHQNLCTITAYRPEKKKKDAEGQNSQDAKDAEEEVEQKRVIMLRHLNIAGLQSGNES
ncbi:ribosome biogenesis ATPase RIX7-like, partial [Trifolium medium]|nr:ribosome biogenesis ATPase RIX7-like [Trifolium medium]